MRTNIKPTDLKLSFVILIFVVWIYIIALYLWNQNSAVDPFYLGRLTQLVNYPNVQFDPTVFADLTLTFFLNLNFMHFLNFSPIQNAYLPIIQIIALFSLLILGKAISNTFESKYKYLFYIVPIIVFVRIFLFVIPYQEYYIGCALYPLVLWAFFKYTENKTFQLSIIIILLFLTIHLFAVPMSTWILVFILSFVFLSFFYNKKNKKQNRMIAPVTLMLLFIVIYIFWNYRLFHSFQMGVFDMNILYNTILNTLYAQQTSGFLEGHNYVVVNTNPITKFAGIIYTILTIVPIGLKFLYEILRKNYFFFLETREDLLIVCMLIPFITEFIIYSSLGNLSLRYLHLIYPFVSYFYVVRFFNNSEFSLNNFITKKLEYFKNNHLKFVKLYLILLILSSAILINVQIENLSFNFAPNQAQDISEWYIDNVPPEFKLSTDFYTLNYLNYYVKEYDKKYNNNYEINKSALYQSTYEYLIKGNTKSNFDYFVVNKISINEPLSQGPPVWNKFAPLIYYINDINSNNKLNLVYDTNFACIYKNKLDYQTNYE